MMNYCSHCGAANKPTSKFCSNCGALISAPEAVRCAICGAANRVDSLYCSACGARINPAIRVPQEKPETLAPLRANLPAILDENLSAPNVSTTPKPTSEEQRQEESKPRAAPRMPEWVKRLRPAGSVETSSAPSTEDAEDESGTPGWLRELKRKSPGWQQLARPRSQKQSDDWLARLRAAASGPPDEPVLEEKPEPPSGSESLPMPKWFADIRPPVVAGTTEITSSASPPPSTPQGEEENLPEWLVQLRNLPVPPEPQPGNPDLGGSGYRQEWEGRETPEWLRQIESGNADPERPHASLSTPPSKGEDARSEAA